jgi:hypothetical protein
MNNPNLTEPGVKYWISQNLKECRKFKDKNISYIYNITMFGLFLVVVSGFLAYKYKGRITLEEAENKNRKKQEYIVSKLQQLALYKKQQESNMLTDLPTW